MRSHTFAQPCIQYVTAVYIRRRSWYGLSSWADSFRCLDSPTFCLNNLGLCLTSRVSWGETITIVRSFEQMMRNSSGILNIYNFKAAKKTTRSDGQTKSAPDLFELSADFFSWSASWVDCCHCPSSQRNLSEGDSLPYRSIFHQWSILTFNLHSVIFI